MAFSIATEAKINYMLGLIEDDPSIGSTRIQNSIKERFGTQLHKQTLLTEAAKYRTARKIEPPTISQWTKFNQVMKLGKYTPAERQQFRQSIETYKPDKQRNFIFSGVLRKTAESHRKWFDALARTLYRQTGNMDAAIKIVRERLDAALRNAQHDPMQQLKAHEEADTIISGMVKIRKLRRDYTEERRLRARREQIKARKALFRT